jgi:SAM-dependent methyltransferase
MTLAFARAYERTATRIMAPVSWAALVRIGTVDSTLRILDIGSGTGALSIPAAHSGASVTAVDIAPGMVELLSKRLAPFPSARALVMDGQALSFADASFDAALSIMGISMFEDWICGLEEQARVLRTGGKAVVATWRTPPGGGPFVTMAQALRALFPDRPPPPAPAGFVALASPADLQRAMSQAGLTGVEVEEIEAEWVGPAGRAYLEELGELHSFMGPYAQLEPETRLRVDDEVLRIVDRLAENGAIRLVTKVLLASGTRD